MSATVLGREIELDGVLEKTCERCDGTGTITVTRDRRIDELTDTQVKFLIYADLFRETGGEDPEETKQELDQARSQVQSAPTRGPSPGGAPTPPNPNSL